VAKFSSVIPVMKKKDYKPAEGTRPLKRHLVTKKHIKSVKLSFEQKRLDA